MHFPELKSVLVPRREARAWLRAPPLPLGGQQGQGSWAPQRGRVSSPMTGLPHRSLAPTSGWHFLVTKPTYPSTVSPFSRSA